MRIVQELVSLGMTQEIKCDSVEYNQPIEESLFELPKEIAELADSAKR